MIPVVLTLEDWEGWTTERNMERSFHSVPRKGELILYKGDHYKVRDVTYDLGEDSFAPIIKIHARVGDN